MSVSLNPEEDPAKATTYVQAKVANEMIKVQKGKVKLKKLKARLVDRQKALTHVFQLAQTERAAWKTWPQTAAVELAEALHLDSQVLFAQLEKGVEAHLRELGDIQPRVD